LVQKPQFSGSVWTLEQLPGVHCCSPAAQLLEQALCEQTWPAAHIVPHAPQLSGSPVVLTQAWPHACRPDVHTHAPATHAWLLPQVVPHVPQLRKSAFVSVQMPLQLVCPRAQEDVPPTPLPPEPLPPLPPLLSSSSGAGPQAAMAAVTVRHTKASRVRARMLRSLHGFVTSPKRRQATG
jgi:hypothetical protein